MLQPDYSLLDRSDILTTVFYPRPDWYPAWPPAREHIVQVDDGAQLANRFYPFNVESPSILYFHGNGEVACDYDGLAPLYHQYGMNLYVADYRGYGGSTGTPRFSTMVRDAHEVYESFKELLGAEGFVDRVFVMGRSLGALSALELAAHYGDGLQGLILESGAGGVSAWQRFIGPSDDPRSWEELRERHIAKVRSIRLPLLTIHGEWDELVPVEQALELRELISSTQKDLEIIRQAGHNDIFVVGMRQYMEALQRFIAA